MSMCGGEAAVFLRGERKKQIPMCPGTRMPGILSLKGFISFQYFFLSETDMVCLLAAVHQTQGALRGEGE